MGIDEDDPRGAPKQSKLSEDVGEANELRCQNERRRCCDRELWRSSCWLCNKRLSRTVVEREAWNVGLTTPLVA